VLELAEQVDGQIGDPRVLPSGPAACVSPVEDRLGVSALGDGAEAHGHLLDLVGDRDEDQQEPDQVVAVLRPRSGVGGHAARVVSTW
jgi:hypothetical protein